MEDIVIKHNDIRVTIREEDGSFKYEDELFDFYYKSGEYRETNADLFSCGDLVLIMRRMDGFVHNDDTFKKKRIFKTIAFAVMNAHNNIAMIKDEKCRDSNTYTNVDFSPLF